MPKRGGGLEIEVLRRHGSWGNKARGDEQLQPQGEPSSGCAHPGSNLCGPRARCSAWPEAAIQRTRPGLVGQETHFLLLNVPRILGMNLPTLLSLVSSSVGPSPPPGPPASSFLQKTSKRL